MDTGVSMADYTLESAVRRVRGAGIKIDAKRRTIIIKDGAGIKALGAIDYLEKNHRYTR